MLKKMMSMVLSLLVLLGTAFPAMADAASATGVIKTEDRHVWDTDIRLSIRREDQLMRESGRELDEWDGEIAQRKQEALKTPLTKEALLKADPDIKILEEDGRVYYIGAGKTFVPVNDAADAYALAYRLVSLLGGTEETDLRLWSRLGINGQTVYSFQEIADSETVVGSTLKIALDENNEVSAVFANLLPDEEGENGGTKPLVSRRQAENAVFRQTNNKQLFRELTERTIRYPVDITDALDLESDDEDPVPQQLLWVVYTSNKGGDADIYPYVAHYVKLDGTYLFNLPVKQPGDAEARSGYRMQDVFAGMTPGEYTGEITDIRGNSRTITVPVMKNEETGDWYLGDPERRIAVADYYELAYDDQHPMNLVTSKTNEDWDNEDLFMYYNYIRAWEFYADMGWIGPDGQGTDVIILKGLAFRNHEPYENACSCGSVGGWQMFGYAPYNAKGKALGLVQGMDVLAHEYTHTFTASVMNENLYENDLGAINEAMSDIMGNLIEYILHDTEDTKWTLGENTGTSIRCMSDPNSKGQPAYVWDLFYGPHTDTPSTNNDRGGVHSNSSLLNRIAALLCLDHGMSYGDAVRFWMTVAMGMTPETDYRQMDALLNWAADASGNEDYKEALNSLIAEERLDVTERPETFPDRQRLAILSLPETETFEDTNWTLVALQLNTETLMALGTEFVSLLMQSRKDASVWQEALQEILSHVSLEGTQIHVDQAESKNEFAEAVLRILRGAAPYRQLLSWEENDTREMPMVEIEGDLTLYILINITGGGSKTNGTAVLIGGQWVDLMNLDKAEMGQLAAQIAVKFVQNLSAEKEGKIVYLPTDGLETVRLSDSESELETAA